MNKLMPMDTSARYLLGSVDTCLEFESLNLLAGGSGIFYRMRLERSLTALYEAGQGPTSHQRGDSCHRSGPLQLDGTATCGAAAPQLAHD